MVDSLATFRYTPSESQARQFCDLPWLLLERRESLKLAWRGAFLSKITMYFYCPMLFSSDIRLANSVNTNLMLTDLQFSFP